MMWLNIAIERVMVASVGTGSTEYPNQLKSYLTGENKNKTNWNTQETIHINRYYLYILHDKENYILQSTELTNQLI